MSSQSEDSHSAICILNTLRPVPVFIDQFCIPNTHALIGLLMWFGNCKNIVITTSLLGSNVIMVTKSAIVTVATANDSLHD